MPLKCHDPAPRPGDLPRRRPRLMTKPTRHTYSEATEKSTCEFLPHPALVLADGGCSVAEATAPPQPPWVRPCSRPLTIYQKLCGPSYRQIIVARPAVETPTGTTR